MAAHGGDSLARLERRSDVARAWPRAAAIRTHAPLYSAYCIDLKRVLDEFLKEATIRFESLLCDGSPPCSASLQPTVASASLLRCLNHYFFPFSGLFLNWFC